MAGGPCTPWVTAADLAGRPDMTDKVVDSGVLEQAAATASSLLFVLSGRQWSGACLATIRPFVGCGGVSWLPGDTDQIDSITAATNGYGSTALRLGLYPIRSIIEIKIDGQVLSPTRYRVDDNRYLVRRDGLSWPGNQNLDLDDTAVGTFAVTVSFGADPPAAGVNAANALGAELAKSRAGLPNRLPQRVQSITRQQVSMTLLDPMTFLDKGLTGVLEADLFIKAVNPQRQTRRPAVWSPDTRSHRRTG